MSKPRARHASTPVRSGYETSIPRCALAIGLALLGIAWIVVYINFAKDAANYQAGLGLPEPSNPLPWMAAMKTWNFAIGFGLIIAALIIAADKRTPLGRGQGVVVGMLFCFILGLVWIVLFYFIGSAGAQVPVMSDLGQWNLAVGIAFMAAGFSFATRWE